MRRCSVCKTLKVPEDFHWKSKRTGRRRSDCKECHNKSTRVRSKKHYKENKDYYLKRNKATQKRISDFVKALKHNKPCTDCKVVYPSWVMHFDHLDADTKVVELSRMSRLTSSEAKVLEEAAKCELVCANCHAERTYRRAQGEV